MIDKTAMSLTTILVFIISGALVTFPLVLMNMGWAYGSLFVLFGFIGLLFYSAALAEKSKSQSNVSSSLQQAIPKTLHKILITIINVLILAIIGWVCVEGKFVLSLGHLWFTLGTWAIGIFWYTGLFLGIGLGLKPDREAALKKILITLSACILTLISLYMCLRVAPEPISSYLIDTAVHMFVAYATLLSSIWPW